MNAAVNYLLLLAPIVVTTLVVIGFLMTMNWLLLVRRPELGNEKRLPRQVTLLVLTLVGIVFIALALPVSESTRNQVIALIGVLTSGVVAFSSTTIIANLMAGIMLRVNRPFKTGDFIRVGDYFGRVSDRGLLDTEIQSEQRELISLPNTYLINNAVAAVSSSGAIISANISLGYDVHHSIIQTLLLAAAEETNLEDPFVQIIELGDFSVSYRVSGLLKDVKSLLTTKSNLYRAILDSLHSNGVEIVSPGFMNQRQLGDLKMIPRYARESPVSESGNNAEAVIFDKAELAEQHETSKQLLQADIAVLEAALKEGGDIDKKLLSEQLTAKRQQLSESGKKAEEAIEETNKPAADTAAS